MTIDREALAPLGKVLRRTGAVILALGVALLGMWITGRSTDPHGMVFVFAGGLFVTLVGATLWTIGYSLKMRNLHR
jgi:hypothetical protein